MKRGEEMLNLYLNPVCLFVLSTTEIRIKIWFKVSLLHSITSYICFLHHYPNSHSIIHTARPIHIKQYTPLSSTPPHSNYGILIKIRKVCGIGSTFLCDLMMHLMMWWYAVWWCNVWYILIWFVVLELYFGVSRSIIDLIYNRNLHIYLHPKIHIKYTTESPSQAKDQIPIIIQIAP